MRWVLAVALLATGCDAAEKPEILACENFIKAKLRSPSTYKRIEANSYPDPKRWSVFISYDAANAYGTPIRALEQCQFAVKESKPVTLNLEDPGRADMRAASANLEFVGRDVTCCMENWTEPLLNPDSDNAMNAVNP